MSIDMAILRAWAEAKVSGKYFATDHDLPVARHILDAMPAPTMADIAWDDEVHAGLCAEFFDGDEVLMIGPDPDNEGCVSEDTAYFIARLWADAGLLRPDPSSRYDGQYGTSFSRDEEAEDGPYIEAYPATHCPAPEWKIVYRAEVLIDIGGQHGSHNLRAYATAEWCREAAAILLDVADEVDYRNNKATADHAEGVGRADA